MLANLSLRYLWASDSKSGKRLEIPAFLRRSQSEWGCFCQRSQSWERAPSRSEPGLFPSVSSHRGTSKGGPLRS